MQIYVLQKGEKAGPFTVYEIADLVRSGEADANTLGWHTGCDGWLPLGEMAAVSVAFNREPEDAEDTHEESAAADTERERDTRRAATLLESEVRPWIRFSARVFDFMAFQLVTFAFGISTGILGKREIYNLSLFDLLAIPAAWIFVETFCLTAFKTTPGKAIFRVRLSTVDGSPLDTKRALSRSYSVWWRGCGFWFAPVTLVAGALSYAYLTSQRTTPWDSAHGVKVTHGGVGPANFALAFLVLYALGQIVSHLAGPPPPFSELFKAPPNG